MAENIALEARVRRGRGKGEARRLRASGMVPAVLYGNGSGESTSLAVPAKVVDHTLQHYGDNALYDLELDGEKKTARVVDVQRDPLTGRLLHVDFAPVDMTERIEVAVPLALVGEPAGVKEGGVLQQVAYEVQVEALPGDIPQEIEVDVSGLGMQENLTLGDVRLPEGIRLVSDAEEVVATVTPPTQISEEELEAAGIVEEEAGEAAPEAAETEAAEEEEVGDGEEES
ncbi:General stress protein CTC [Rubrobacter xylanophilus DSM 9941]|uniref:50S ribosomal protein L25 n=1 Tax=Rubrobacter xylanophilus TaxID=49319 RepID=UPI001C63DFB8|nr:50S ribosomal protein L25 [Rubrobacter xylanophilus]QYJ17099.1 General stress protein CTC [Rubrobacter xylanophilus DSM 9941]